MAGPTAARRNMGQVAFHGGLAAEGLVARHYKDRGAELLAERWRGTGGEIDLILRLDDVFVFVEVKKSGSFAKAALRVSRAQQQRIFSTALEFAATQPRGQLSHMRFDVALVDGIGAVEILENALFCD